MKYLVTRTVTKNECEWLRENILAGTPVYEFNGPTYGCIGPNGVAVSLEDGANPFFELPFDALQPFKSIEEA